jgi:purine-binding chemotaxis protein CheW
MIGFEEDDRIRYYLTFRVGRQWYAVDVQMIFEVSQMVNIAPVPDMPEAILGIVNVRGRIVPIIDLRRRFKTGDHQLELNTPIIFVLHGRNTYGMVVDDVDDVMQLSKEMITETSLNDRAEHISGLVDYNERLIMLLEPFMLLVSSLQGRDLDQFQSIIKSGNS